MVPQSRLIVHPERPRSDRAPKPSFERLDAMALWIASNTCFSIFAAGTRVVDPASELRPLRIAPRNIVAPTLAAFGGMAWAHPVAAIVVELASEKGFGIAMGICPSLRLLRKPTLDAVPDHLFDHCWVASRRGSAPCGEAVRHRSGSRGSMYDVASADQAAARHFATFQQFGPAIAHFLHRERSSVAPRCQA